MVLFCEICSGVLGLEDDVICTECDLMFAAPFDLVEGVDDVSVSY